MGIGYYQQNRYYDWKQIAKWRKACAKAAKLSLEAERKAELAALHRELARAKTLNLRLRRAPATPSPSPQPAACANRQSQPGRRFATCVK